MFYVQTFLDHLSANHYRPKTIRDYRYLLNRLVSYFSQQQIADITGVPEGMIRDFLKLVSNGDPNRKSEYVKICRLRKYFRFLEDKGVLRHSKRGREYVFRPTRTKRRAARSAVKRVLNVFFGGSLGDAVAAHLADPRSRPSAEELARLERLIREARKKGK